MSNPAAMSNPTGPDDRRDANQRAATTGDDAAAATEIFEPADPATDPTIPVRRFTAPSSFDGKTQIIAPLPDPETELMPPAAPQQIPGTVKSPKDRRSWGWVIALVLVIAAIAALAVLGTVLLTRGHSAMNPERPGGTSHLGGTTTQDSAIPAP